MARIPAPQSQPRPHGHKRPFVVFSPGDEVVIHTYKVVLKPDSSTEYDPIVVSLKYAPEAAPDPNSKQAHREAFARAVRVERKANDTPASRTFLDGGVTLVRSRLTESR